MIGTTSPSLSDLRIPGPGAPNRLAIGIDIITSSLHDDLQTRKIFIPVTTIGKISDPPTQIFLEILHRFAICEGNVTPDERLGQVDRSTDSMTRFGLTLAIIAVCSLGILGKDGKCADIDGTGIPFRRVFGNLLLGTQEET